MTDSRRWRNRGVAAGAVTAVLFALFDLYQWALAFAGDKFHNDFTFYYAAARVGLEHRWHSIYDLRLQQVELDALLSRIPGPHPAHYLTPPPPPPPLTPLPA